MIIAGARGRGQGQREGAGAGGGGGASTCQKAVVAASCGIRHRLNKLLADQRHDILCDAVWPRLGLVVELTGISGRVGAQYIVCLWISQQRL